MRPSVRFLQRLASDEFGLSLLVAGEVEPLFPPTLDGVGLPYLEVGGVTADLDAEPANWILSTALADIALHHEYGLPEPPVGLDAQEALAQHKIAGEAKHSIGIRIVDLNPVHV